MIWCVTNRVTASMCVSVKEVFFRQTKWWREKAVREKKAAFFAEEKRQNESDEKSGWSPQNTDLTVKHEQTLTVCIERPVVPLFLEPAYTFTRWTMHLHSITGSWVFTPSYPLQSLLHRCVLIQHWRGKGGWKIRSKEGWGMHPLLRFLTSLIPQLLLLRHSLLIWISYAVFFSFIVPSLTKKKTEKKMGREHHHQEWWSQPPSRSSDPSKNHLFFQTITYSKALSPLNTCKCTVHCPKMKPSSSPLTLRWRNDETRYDIVCCWWWCMILYGVRCTSIIRLLLSCPFFLSTILFSLSDRTNLAWNSTSTPKNCI